MKVVVLGAGLMGKEIARDLVASVEVWHKDHASLERS